MAGEALASWRGRAFGDLADEPFAAARAAQLEERRLAVIELGYRAALALGHHRDVIGEIEQSVARHPLREQLWVLLMTALYRAGRQAEALRSFARVRKLLADQLGVLPCPDLVRLESAVLSQDPSLDWPAAPVLEPKLDRQSTEQRPWLQTAVGNGSACGRRFP